MFDCRGANNALDQIQELQRQHLIKVHDAAIVYWPVGQKSPSIRQLVDLVSAGAVTGMFLGVLFGAIFFMPLLGMAVGTAIGALGGSLRDYGIDGDFINRVRGQVTEGTSALFLMTSDAVLDRVADAMKHLKFEIISTNLSREQERNSARLLAKNSLGRSRSPMRIPSGVTETLSADRGETARAQPTTTTAEAPGM